MHIRGKPKFFAAGTAKGLHRILDERGVKVDGMKGRQYIDAALKFADLDPSKQKTQLEVFIET